MAKLRWAFLFSALTVFLTACPPGTVPGALGVSLAASPTTLPAGGGPVTLTATVTNGPADQVEFFNGALSIGVDAEAPYTVTETITATSTFRAVASAGDVDATSTNVTVTVGSTDELGVSLAANTTTLPAGGGEVVLTATVTNGPADEVEFFNGAASIRVDTEAPYTASETITATSTFTAVVSAGDEDATSNSVTVTVGTGAGTPYPDGFILVDSPEDINAAPAGAIMVAEQTIACTKNFDQGGDPCIVLKENQRLLGGDGEFLFTTPGVKISSDIPVGPGNSDDSAKITVVSMANGTSVEGIEFDGTDIYTALSAPDTITGDVTIKNVAVGETSNAPIRLESVGAVTIEGLTLTTNRALFIEGFTSVNLKNLDLTINREPAATGAALSIVSDVPTSTVVVDGLDVATNLGGTNKDGVLIQSGEVPADAGAMTATVANSSVTFPEADVATSIAFNFNVVGTGSIAIQTAASTGNTTNSTSPFRATYDTGVTGTIQITEEID